MKYQYINEKCIVMIIDIVDISWTTWGQWGKEGKGTGWVKEEEEEDTLWTIMGYIANNWNFFGNWW